MLRERRSRWILGCAVLGLWTIGAGDAQGFADGDLYDGIAAYEASDYRRAETILQGLELSELSELERVMAHKYLAATLFADGRREEAEAAFTRLLEIEPEYALDPQTFAPDLRATFGDAKRRLADGLHEAGVEALRADLADHAAALFERVLTLDPGHPSTRDFLEIARAKREQQKQIEAREEPPPAPPPPAAPPPAPAPMEVTEIRPLGYRIGVLERGEPAYVDRDFRLEDVPAAYRGLVSLKTANADKRETKAAVSFTVNQGVEVFVAHDRRIKAKPLWLTAFRSTGERLTVLESIEERKQTVYHIHSAIFEAGEVELGANSTDRSKHKSSMYLVFFRPRVAAR